MPLKFTNYARGYLNSSITAAATSITLQAGNGASFPSLSTGDYFYATLVDPTSITTNATPARREVVKVTGRTGDVLTVTRAQDGTTAQAFNALDVVELRLSAAQMDILKIGMELNVKDYGAVGDGATDDTAAFQAAITAAATSTVSCRVIVDVPSVGWKITSSLTVPSGVHILGRGRRSKILHYGSSNLFKITGSGVYIKDLYIDSSNATAGYEFNISTDTNSIEFVTIENVEATSTFGLVVDDNHASNIAIEVRLIGLVARLCRGRGIYLRDCTAYLFLKDITIDYVGSASADFVAYEIVNNLGAVLDRCDVTGGSSNGTPNTSQNAFVISACQAVWLKACMADTCGGIGFYIKSTSANIYLEQCVSSLCFNHQFAVSASQLVHMSQCVAYGRNALVAPPAAKHGFYASGAVLFWDVTGCTSMYNTGNGFYQEDPAQGLTMSGSRAYSNTLNGLKTTGASSYSLSTGTQFVSNVVNNADLATNKDHANDCQANSGALFNLTGPGTA